MTLSWTLSTDSQVDIIKVFEIFTCEASSTKSHNDNHTWKTIGTVNAEPGIMTATITGVS